MESRRNPVRAADQVNCRLANGRNADGEQRLFEAVEGVGFADDADAGIAGKFLQQLRLPAPAGDNDR